LQHEKNTIRTCINILGLNKMVINQLEKLFVTSDAATVIKELEVKTK
jgi:T-complex protein 1 subunit theta